MKVQRLQINNYKSLVNVEVKNPQPFTVFVGPNASGKSNLFEAIEFWVSASKNYLDTARLFGGSNAIVNRKVNNPATISISAAFESFSPRMNMILNDATGDSMSTKQFGFPETEDEIEWSRQRNKDFYWDKAEYKQFFLQYSRIFINSKSEKIPYKDDKKLSTACGNLEQVLKRILKDDNKKEEIVEWLQLLVPGFENIEIKSEDLSGTDNLLIYEIGSEKPFPKHLISDGTFNIIALLTAIYQSDEPQFLCIEEPENGLNPKVIQELVGLFRQQCEEKGHHIWINTHSQTLVRELTAQEIIIVDKKDGETKIKQIPDFDLHGLKMDEALLSNAIGGGIPW
jgi:predicted ATPase